MTAFPVLLALLLIVVACGWLRWHAHDPRNDEHLPTRSAPL